jgi:antibiotic biosynthesis monooxygenase (ABM) superfamily enzyme
MSEPSPNEPGVTLVATHHLRPGEEVEFQRRMHELMQVESRFDGYRGAELIAPVPGVQENWITLIRFDNDVHMRAWLDSSERNELLANLQPTVEHFDVQQIGGSFGAWFAPSREGEAAPPNWKQAMTVLLMLYPTVMVITLFLSPRLHLSMSTGMFVGNVVSVAALTWLLMPLANRALTRWLAPDASARTTVIGTLSVLVLYALLLVLFAVTT